MLPPNWSSCGKVHSCCPIFQHQHGLRLIIKILQFGIWFIIIRLGIDIFACFKDEGLDASVIYRYKCVVIKMTAMSIQENYFIVDRGGAAYIGQLSYGSLKHQHGLCLIIKILQFGIWFIIIRLGIDIFVCFKDEGLDASVIYRYKCVVIKMTAMSIQENYFIVDRGGAAYIG